MKVLMSMMILIFSFSVLGNEVVLPKEEGKVDELVTDILMLSVDHNNQIDVHRTGMNGVTVLHLVSESGEAHLVPVLVDMGAGIDATDHKGNTPLLHLACNDNLDLSQEQVVSMAEMLLENNANVNVQNNKGQTIIHCIVETHQEYLLPVFEEYDFDFSIKDDKRRTAESMLSVI